MFSSKKFDNLNPESTILQSAETKSKEISDLKYNKEDLALFLVRSGLAILASAMISKGISLYNQGEFENIIPLGENEKSYHVENGNITRSAMINHFVGNNTRP